MRKPLIAWLAIVGAYDRCHHLRADPPAVGSSGWLRALVDSWSLLLNRLGKRVPCFGNPPFGSTHDLLFAGHTGGRGAPGKVCR